MTIDLAASHGSNVTSLQSLNSAIVGYGSLYNPTNAGIKLPALLTIYTLGLNAVNAVDAAQPASTNAKASRDLAFGNLSKLATRVNNAFISVEPGKSPRSHVRSLVNVVQTGRVNSKKSEPEVIEPATETKDDKDNASHKLKFENRLSSLNKLIQYLASFPAYKPNETELSVEGLTALYNDLSAKNQLAINTEIPLTNARIARNSILYNPVTGLVQMGNDSKSYIKSVFGATSPQYRQISKLKFRYYNN